MSKTATDNTVLNEGRTALRFWTDNSDIKVNETTSAGLKRLLDDLETKSNDAKLKEEELRQLNLERDRLTRTIRKVDSLLKMAARVRYGADSSEYAALGGTRLMDRKPRSRSVSPATPANGNGNGKGNGAATSVQTVSTVTE